MKYIRKTRDVFDVQGLYNGTWEVVTAEDNRFDARQRLKEYRENEPQTIFRIKRTREKIDDTPRLV